MITLTLRSSNELRIDHKLVNAESQTKFDFQTRKTRKAIKERKNTYEGSPNANLDPRISGMKQWFQLRASKIKILVGFAMEGMGYL